MAGLLFVVRLIGELLLKCNLCQTPKRIVVVNSQSQEQVKPFIAKKMLLLEMGKM